MTFLFTINLIRHESIICEIGQCEKRSPCNRLQNWSIHFQSSSLFVQIYKVYPLLKAIRSSDFKIKRLILYGKTTCSLPGDYDTSAANQQSNWDTSIESNWQKNRGKKEVVWSHGAKATAVQACAWYHTCWLLMGCIMICHWSFKLLNDSFYTSKQEYMRSLDTWCKTSRFTHGSTTYCEICGTESLMFAGGWSTRFSYIRKQNNEHLDIRHMESMLQRTVKGSPDHLRIENNSQTVPVVLHDLNANDIIVLRHWWPFTRI